MPDSPNISEIIDFFKTLQDEICMSLEAMDGHGRFKEDTWERPGGGGGRSRVILGQHIEKGGVMFSAVHGEMPEAIAKSLSLPENNFSATGVSIVLHPKNPWVPIIHMNVRYFQTDKGHWWFGGGIDASPHYINLSEAQRFHRLLKNQCDKFSLDAYAKYKKWADDYFFIRHREETRGIGGIFFDRLNDEMKKSKEECWTFVKAIGNSFIPAYHILFDDNYIKAYDSNNKLWQNVRRSRYVEFNLVYDRGTKFGLQTNGRIESILVSMPPDANWIYNYQPTPNSNEWKTQNLLRKGIDWINYTEE